MYFLTERLTSEDQLGPNSTCVHAVLLHNIDYLIGQQVPGVADHVEPEQIPTETPLLEHRKHNTKLSKIVLHEGKHGKIEVQSTLTAVGDHNGLVSTKLAS